MKPKFRSDAYIVSPVPGSLECLYVRSEDDDDMSIFDSQEAFMKTDLFTKATKAEQERFVAADYWNLSRAPTKAEVENFERLFGRKP